MHTTQSSTNTSFSCGNGKHHTCASFLKCDCDCHELAHSPEPEIENAKVVKNDVKPELISYESLLRKWKNQQPPLPPRVAPPDEIYDAFEGLEKRVVDTILDERIREFQEVAKIYPKELQPPNLDRLINTALEQRKKNGNRKV